MVGRERGNGKGIHFLPRQHRCGLTAKVDKPGVKGWYRRRGGRDEGAEVRTANKTGGGRGRGCQYITWLWLVVSNDTVQYIIQIAMLIQL